MKLIAHRGASAHAPENTMAAFRLALEMGARAIELDVHQTRDGRLAVIHDDDLKRVAGLRRRVRDMDWKDLASRDVGSWFAPKFAAERVPSLEEVLDLVAGRAELHVEIKAGSRRHPGIEERVVSLLKRRQARDWAVVSSFDHACLFRVRELDADARIGYLLGTTSMKRALAEIGRLRGESLHMSRSQAGPWKIARAHEAGLALLAYTVNKKKDMMRLEKMGVDGVFSNAPELGDERS